MRAQLALLLFSTLAVGAAAAPHASTGDRPQYGLAYMARFDRLPVLKDTVCRQVSSYSRSGGNDDFGHFLNGDAGHLPNDTAVLADLKGPGCVYRLWSANATGNIRFYFDGESEPRIACPMQDLFTNNYPPFRTPLAGRSSGGWYSYFPIPYSRSLRIEVEHPGQMYYHVQYQELPAGAQVRSFTREIAPEDEVSLAAVLRNWSAAGSMPGEVPGKLARHTGARELRGGERVRILQSHGSGVVRALRVKADPSDRFALRELVVRAYWDGAARPAVEAPLGDFFGSGFGEHTFRAQPLAMGPDGYACFFPMPFARGARIEIANEGSRPLRLSWETEVGALPAGDEPLGRFHAKWRQVRTESGKHVTLLDTTGRGHFVGVTLSMQGDRGIGFLEGDEKIYVDGESSPSIYGTGTEDYFTAGWYFDEGPFSLPYHGAIVKDEPNSRINAYRYQITDCVPFRKSIRVDIEHGGVNDYPGAEYFYTTYWYAESPTDDWAPLPMLADRRPTPPVSQEVIEAESLPLVGARVVDDRDLPIETSRGAAVRADVPGQPFTVMLNAGDATAYTLSLGLLRGPDAGKVAVWLDGRPLGELLDLHDPSPNVERIRVGTTGLLTKGPHRLTLRPLGLPGANQVVLDYVGMRPMLYPGAFEAEKLTILQRTPDVPLEPQGMQPFGPRWSDDQQLWFRPTAAGASFTLEVPVETTGRYRVLVYLTKAVDYGQVEMRLDGRKVGSTFDGYHEGVIPSGPVDLGTMELSSGAHRLQFTVTGKNAQATGYLVGVDAIQLQPQP